MSDPLPPSAIPLEPRRRRAELRRARAEAPAWHALAAVARRSAARVLRLPQDHADVEDRAQDALALLVAAGLPRFDARRGTLEALVATIARNCAASHLRGQRLRTRAAASILAHDRAPSCDGGQRRVEARADLGRVLSLLRPDHAEALLAIDLEGERIGDAARRQGRSYAAVNAEVGHARAFARRAARELLVA